MPFGRGLGRRALVFGLWLAAFARPACALEPPARVSVLTMGPGDHPFTRFGHNAILLEWNGGGPAHDAVYNFGTFEFDGVQGATDFMAGRFRYWLSVGTLEGTLQSYAADHRDLTAQELELTSAERSELFARLADNARLEHRFYDYDYYRDNCSTRVRDALDRVLGGALEAGVLGRGRLSFRQHTLRLTGDTPWLYFGLDAALGTPTDRPITRWEELFLPAELHDALARATRTVDGERVPLVRAERHLLTAARAPLPSRPPERRLLFALIGSSLGALAAITGALARRQGAARVSFGVVTSILGTALGLFGTALTIFSWSKHWAAHDNLSLLACPPWALALAPLGLGVALARTGEHGRKAQVLRATLGASLLTASTLLLLSIFESAEAERMAFLFAPLWAGWFYGAWLATTKERR